MTRINGLFYNYTSIDLVSYRGPPAKAAFGMQLPSNKRGKEISMKYFKNSRKALGFLCAGCLLFHAHAGSAQPFNPLLLMIEQMPEKSWVKANQNTFWSVWTPPRYQVLPDSSYGSNISAIIGAWSSFAWDSNRGNMILYGGGHANYGGNEIYTWQSSTLLWQRSSLPTQIELPPGGYYWRTVGNDVSPLSAHTYDNNVFLTQIDRFLTFGGFVFNAGTPYYKFLADGSITTTGPYLFDPNRADGNKVGGADGTGVDPLTPGGQMWQNRDIYANQPSSPLPQGFYNGMAVQTVENGKDVVYVVGAIQTNSSLYRYQINVANDPSKDSWTRVGDMTTLSGQGAGAYDPNNKIFLRTGFASTPFLYWDINHPGPIKIVALPELIDNTNGALTFDNLLATGMDFDPIRKRFMLWGGGNYVYTLTEPDGADSWKLSIDNFGFTNGPGGTSLGNDFSDGGLLSGGVLGKWHYAANFDVFVGLKNRYNGNVWIYKPEGWSPPHPDTDQDGVIDASDNCVLAFNSDQRDTDQDGFGNICDADLNNDLMVNAVDQGLFKKCYLKQASDAQCPHFEDSDFNADSKVNAQDLGLLKTMYQKPPGPSGVGGNN
jgi:hypothetical protein